MRTDVQGKALTRERYDYIMGEQLKSRPEYRYFWNDQTVPVAAAAGPHARHAGGEAPSNVAAARRAARRIPIVRRSDSAAVGTPPGAACRPRPPK